jgi:type II secretory pathway component PulF
MAIIVTPKQLTLRAELYHQLGSMLEAGLTLHKAIDTLSRNPPARSFRAPLEQLRAHLQHGETFTRSLKLIGGWVPSFDIALLEAGENSGRLDVCFKQLSGYYEERAELLREVMTSLAYPLFILHFAIFIGPFPKFFMSGNLFEYLAQTIGTLAPLYGAVALVIFACQGRHGEMWRGLIEKMVGFIPILGTARRSLALGRLAAALEALINAGLSIINAWELAATASGSPALRRAVLLWRPGLERGGKTPSEQVSVCEEFPELFANLYHSGEISGKLDETLRRLHSLYQEEGSRKLKLVAKWFPILAYLAIMLKIAYQVVTFYVGYFDQINQVIGP